MEVSSGRSRTRLMVVDFLATLFVTFCIGVGTALVLAACVVLMAGEARGAPPAGPNETRPAQGAPATIADLVLAHYFAAKYAGLVAVERAYAIEDPAETLPENRGSGLPKGCEPDGSPPAMLARLTTDRRVCHPLDTAALLLQCGSPL